MKKVFVVGQQKWYSEWIEDHILTDNHAALADAHRRINLRNVAVFKAGHVLAQRIDEDTLALDALVKFFDVNYFTHC